MNTLAIAGRGIYTDAEGRYHLSDLHRASGGETSIFVLCGNAQLSHCDLNISEMDGVPRLGLGASVTPLNDPAPLRQPSYHLDILIPAINPVCCGAQQCMPCMMMANKSCTFQAISESVQI